MATERLDEETVFSAALERRTPAERCAYLDAVCRHDTQLRASVDRLLQLHAEAEGFLESPPLDDVHVREIEARAEPSGTTIDRYKLLELIGEGGFGDVYMAEQQEPVRREVALKIIKLGMNTRQVIARFEAERQALALMDHPHIAKVLDAGATESGRPYFVMDLVRGSPITEYCDANKLTTQDRLQLFKDVCHAVQHAHQKGIIHRDLKPTNVLVTQRDNKPVPKIIDFGVAKATQQRLTEKTLFTEHRQLVGTPEYMSPEQATLGEADIDTRSDIYSLGVLLYELVVGTTPFDAKDLRGRGYDEICRVIREDDPATPSRKLSALGDSVTGVCQHRQAHPAALQKLLRGDLDWIVMKCLEKDRTRRYETAEALALDIERHLCDEPIRARPPSTAYQAKKFLRKHRTKVAATAVILGTVIIGLAVSIALIENQRSMAVSAAKEQQELRAEADLALQHAEEQLRRALSNAELARAHAVDPLAEAADYKIFTGANSDEKLTLHPNSILQWDYAPNMSRLRGGQVGSLFVWLHVQRPEVIGAIFNQFQGQRNETRVATKHEFHSLSKNPLVARYSDETVWTPAQAGIDLRPLMGAPPPSRTRHTRLAQMKQLASQFTAYLDEQDNRSLLRLRPEPIYRYADAGKETVDGALFAFLYGSDPELVLLIEAPNEPVDAQWHYALARLTLEALTVEFRGKPIWDQPPTEYSKGDILNDPEYQRRSYISYVPKSTPKFALNTHSQELARNYDELLSAFRGAGRHREAAQAAIGALSTWRYLADDTSVTRCEHLLRVNQHAVEALRRSGRLREATEAATEAVTLYEELARDLARDDFHGYLGYMHAELGRWNEAATAYAKASEVASERDGSRYWHAAAALARLGAGDNGAYRDAITKLLEQYGSTADERTAACMAEACLYMPDTVTDPDRLLQFAGVLRGAGLIDDFNDLSDDGWTRVDLTLERPWGPATFDASSGAYVLQGRDDAPNGPGSAIGSIWDGSTHSQFSHGFLRAKVRANTEQTLAGLGMRASGKSADQMDFYHFIGNAATGNFAILRIDDGSNPMLARLNDAELRFTAGEDWVFEAGAVGEQLTLRVWRDGDREPAAPQMTATDGTLTSGRFFVEANVPGSSRLSGLVSATFDDIYFTPYVAPAPTVAAGAKLPYEGVLAAAMFRAGHCEDAARRLSKLSSEFVAGQSQPNNIVRPWTWLFLSMALHEVGDFEAAQFELDKAIEWMESTAPNATGQSVARIDRLKCYERLRLKVLRQEAEQLLRKL